MIILFSVVNSMFLLCLLNLKVVLFLCFFFGHLIVTYCITYGRMQDLPGGGQLFLSLVELHAAKRHAARGGATRLIGGFRGILLR